MELNRFQLDISENQVDELCFYLIQYIIENKITNLTYNSTVHYFKNILKINISPFVKNKKIEKVET